jgi:hypothetical protein
MDGKGEDVIRHGRTMDLFAGAVDRENASGVLWVCDRCFKYMTDGPTACLGKYIWCVPVLLSSRPGHKWEAC